MKTKRIAKIIGLGLATALAFSLGSAIMPTSADPMEWSTIDTPSWTDNVIAPGSDIYDYAVSPDGETIVAVGGVDIADVVEIGSPAGLTGAFNVTGGTVTLTEISSTHLTVEGNLTGDACYLQGAFASCIQGIADEWWANIYGEITGDPCVSPFDGTGNDNDTMTFTGHVYSDGFDLGPYAGVYGPSVTSFCVDEWELGGSPFGLDLQFLDAEGVYTQPRVWKSTDGGVTFSDITMDVQDADNLPGPFLTFGYGGVAIAPDDEDWFVIAGNACNASGWWGGVYPTGFTPPWGWFGLPAAVATEDGGSNYSYTGDMTDTGSDTWMAEMYDVAVSPEVDGIHYIATAGINDMADGAIFRLDAGTWLTGSWEDTTNYNGWDDHTGVYASGLDVNTNAVIWCEFSPNMDLDDTIVTLCAANPYTGSPIPTGQPVWMRQGLLPYLQMGTWGANDEWNNEAGFPDATLIDNEGSELLTGIYIRSMQGTLPADFDGTDSGARSLYVYVNGQDQVTGHNGGFLFRIDDGSVSEPYGPSGEPLLSSIDFHGDADTGKMMVGTYIGWDQAEGLDPGDEVVADPCAGVAVYHTVELDPCCPDWEAACKDPSGPYGAIVTYTPDGEKAYASTSGMIDLYYATMGDGYSITSALPAGWQDESAFSVSLDDGVSFNQLSLIDTDIDRISDIAVCPDCSVIYMSTFNDYEYIECDTCLQEPPFTVTIETWAECDSVWRSYDNGDTWERIFHGDWTSNHRDILLLRLPCDDTEDCCTVYLGVQATDMLFYTRDCGQCWTQTPGTKIDIHDVAVPTENEVMIIDTDGYFSMSDQFGRRWTDEVDTEVGSGHVITSCCLDDLVIVAGAADEPVAFSEDAGETWNLTDDLPGDSGGTAHVTCDPNCPGTIYAALNGYGIYRTTIDDGSWTDLNACDLAYTGIKVARTGGAVYASYLGYPSYDESGDCVYDCDQDTWGPAAYTGVARNLDPCDTACCGSEDWDYLEAGLGVDTESFRGYPDALRICGCLTMDTPSVLYTVDRWLDTIDGDYPVCDGSDGQIWTYEDCTAKKAPELISPTCGEDIPSEPCEGCTNVDINLCWTNICGACEYDIEIATDEDFTQTIGLYSSYWDEHVNLNCYEPASCADPCFLIPSGALQAGTTYYWRVRVHEVDTGDIAHSQWSETCSFNVMAGAGAGVSLLAPENGSMGIGNENVGFSWTAVGGATSYSFVLSPNSDLSGALASEELSSTAYTYTGMLDYSTPYFWQVTAWKDGSELSTSDVGAFTTAAEPEPEPEPPPPPEPAPEIVIPAAEQITPNWIIAVIAIGAALAVLVIVLIVRTRRP